MVIYFVLGLALGMIVPTAILSQTVLKGLRIEIKEHDEAKANIEKAREELSEIERELGQMKNKQWTRADVPYDAMGDYSDLNIDLVCSDDDIFPKIVDGAKYRIDPGDVSNRISFPTSTGMESPDEWYREQFGGNR